MRKIVFPWIFLLCFPIVALSSVEYSKADLRAEALRVEEQFQREEISETTAIEKLDAIEKKALELKNPPKLTPVETPKEVSQNQQQIEETASAMLLRRAALPELSLGAMIWNFFRPILITIIIVIGILLFILAVFTTNGLHILMNIIGDIYSKIRENHFPGRPPRNQPSVPPTIPPTIVRNISTPSPRNRSIPQPPTGRRHSGEVPDTLT